MDEQKRLRKQLFKYIKSNLLIFIYVFIIFGLFMMVLVHRITYSSVDIELKEHAHNIKKVLRELDIFEIKAKFDEINELQEYTVMSSITNPKLICIIRDEDGEILTSNVTFASNDMLEDFDFNEKKIDKMYTVGIDDEYFYNH